MDRFPFGIKRLDTIIDGGAPAGSVVIVSGDPGAGAREFLYTAAALNGLALADEELFELYYGDLEDNSTLPGGVHYVSFTDAAEQVHREMSLAMDEEIVDAGLEAVDFHDLSGEYFRLSPVPREWYVGETETIADLGTRSDRGDVPDALTANLEANAPGNLVLIDSLTELVDAAGAFEWRDIPMLLRGMSRAAFDWEGLVVAHVNHETLSDAQYGQLVDAADGAFRCEWEQGGSTLARTMMVQQFRGVLSRLEEESIVQFETEIGGTGFDISDVQKIR